MAFLCEISRVFRVKRKTRERSNTSGRDVPSHSFKLSYPFGNCKKILESLVVEGSKVSTA